jgi:hypothetical protein
MAVITRDKRHAPFHPEQRDKEQAEVMVYPFGGKFMETASGTGVAILVQADCSGLNAGDEQKHALASSINIALSDPSANSFTKSVNVLIIDGEVASKGSILRVKKDFQNRKRCPLRGRPLRERPRGF